MAKVPTKEKLTLVLHRSYHHSNFHNIYKYFCTCSIFVNMLMIHTLITLFINIATSEFDLYNGNSMDQNLIKITSRVWIHHKQ